jgi:hypothetical protein
LIVIHSLGGRGSMGGSDGRYGALFSYVDAEARIRRDHPLRQIRELAILQQPARAKNRADMQRVYSSLEFDGSAFVEARLIKVTNPKSRCAAAKTTRATRTIAPAGSGLSHSTAPTARRKARPFRQFASQSNLSIIATAPSSEIDQ